MSITAPKARLKPAISFFAQGIPKGQPRVRACRRGNHSGTYDPGTADEWKYIVRLEARSAWNGEKFEGAVRVKLNFLFPRPKCHFNRNGLKDLAPTRHTSRPDSDNLAKAVLDALTNLGLWRDDSQVSTLIVVKNYSNNGTSGVQIDISEDGL
jgi:Holliday junction resolvase RusA-like endonuclease